MKRFFVAWYLVCSVLASLFIGIIAHEVMHIWQFGFNVYTIGIIWGVQPNFIPIPTGFVAAGQGVQQIENMELIGDITQAIVSIGFFFFSLWTLEKYKKELQ